MQQQHCTTAVRSLTAPATMSHMVLSSPWGAVTLLLSSLPVHCVLACLISDVLPNMCASLPFLPPSLPPIFPPLSPSFPSSPPSFPSLPGSEAGC